MRIKDLTSKTSAFSSSDQFATDNGTAVTKTDFNAVANAMLTSYAGTTLNGSAQTVQAAINGVGGDFSNLFPNASTST